VVKDRAAAGDDGADAVVATISATRAHLSRSRGRPFVAPCSCLAAGHFGGEGCQLGIEFLCGTEQFRVALDDHQRGWFDVGQSAA